MLSMVTGSCLSVAPGSSKAQTVSWAEQTDLSARTPEGVTVFAGTDPGIPVKAWYVAADPSTWGWAADAVLSRDSDGVESVGDITAAAGAAVGINGGYFGGGQSFSLVASAGQVLANNIGALNRSGTIFYPTRSAFGILADGTSDVAWIYNVNGEQYAYPAPSPNAEGSPQPQPDAAFPPGGDSWPVVTGIGGGPVIVADGQRQITWEEEVFFGSGIGAVESRNPRTAIGYTDDGTLILMVVDGRQLQSAGATLTELADMMIAVGAVEAVNLDGGGSSTLVIDGELINRPEGGVAERQVASAFVLKDRSDKPSGSIFDTGDVCCYRETGGWFESANTPFYGTTPSRLNETGTGDEFAVFTFEQIQSAEYEIDVWFVPAANRATDTPHTVFQTGVGTTIPVDQSDMSALGSWVTLGEFALSSGDSLVITDASSGTTTPSYVVADAVRLMPTTATGVVPDLPIDYRADYRVRMYPLPASTFVTLEVDTKGFEAISIDLLDVTGRIVRSIPVADVSPLATQTWVGDLASAMYILRLALRDGVIHRPLVVAR